jgi:hypothetical protein
LLNTIRSRRMTALREKSAVVQKARMFAAHVMLNLLNTIERGVFESSECAYFGLDSNTTSVAIERDEMVVGRWLKIIDKGEKARLKDRLYPVMPPNLAEVMEVAQELKDATRKSFLVDREYHTTNRSFAETVPPLDLHILILWNSFEVGLPGTPKPNRRAQARHFGIEYINTPTKAGEASDETADNGTASDFAVDHTHVDPVEPNSALGTQPTDLAAAESSNPEGELGSQPTGDDAESDADKRTDAPRDDGADAADRNTDSDPHIGVGEDLPSQPPAGKNEPAAKNMGNTAIGEPHSALKRIPNIQVRLVVDDQANQFLPHELRLAVGGYSFHFDDNVVGAGDFGLAGFCHTDARYGLRADGGGFASCRFPIR